MTQKSEILSVMSEKGGITTMDAYERGITRLASRIHELRRMGYDIVSEQVTGKNRHCKTFRCVRYKFA
jgi:hypothetical protein